MIRTFSSICFCLLLFFTNASAQNVYRFKVLTWNLLNWPSTTNPTGDSAVRLPAYRTVIDYAQPDIVVTQENTLSYSSNWFLTQVMNKTSYHYQAGTFINGYDTDN